LTQDEVEIDLDIKKYPIEDQILTQDGVEIDPGIKNPGNP